MRLDPNGLLTNTFRNQKLTAPGTPAQKFGQHCVYTCGVIQYCPEVQILEKRETELKNATPDERNWNRYLKVHLSLYKVPLLHLWLITSSFYSGCSFNRQPQKYYASTWELESTSQTGASPLCLMWLFLMFNLSYMETELQRNQLL